MRKSSKRTASTRAAVAEPDPLTRYTVRDENTLTGFGAFRGVYDSYGEAEAAAQERAKRSQTFMRFQIYRGTPRFRRRAHQTSA